MEVKMKTIYAGPEQTCHPGGILSVSKEEAKDLVDGGYAVYCLKIKTEEAEEVKGVEEIKEPKPEKKSLMPKVKPKKGRGKINYG